MRNRFSISLIWVAIFALTANTFAQDFTQSDLPEGAKARLDKGTISEIAYSPDGKYLAVAISTEIWLYDAQTGKELNLLTGHTDVVISIAFSPDGNTLASIALDGTMLLWELHPAAPAQLVEDVNKDGVVNILDLTLVASNFGKSGKNDADVNADDLVNILDLVLVAAAFGNLGR